MPQEQVHSVGRSQSDPDAVWAHIRDFCTPWHPAIATMRAERGAEGGLIRAFTVHGEDALYREQLTYFSDSDRVMTYRHVAGIAGVEHYQASLSVAPSDEGQGSTVTMTASLTAPPARARAIAQGTQAIFDSGLAALATVPGNPAPAKPMPPPAPITPILLDGPPRLSLSVTPDRAGPLCLFLHGIGGGRPNWDQQLASVGPHMRAAALDLRGYGDSALGAAQSTVDDYCDDILRVRARLGADKLVLCGLSYGAWIATSFAMRHPKVLAGLVLSGGCTGMSEADPKQRATFRESRAVPLAAGQTPADFAPALVQAIAGPGADDTMRATLYDSMAGIAADTYGDALTCFTNPLETFDFAELDMPVLMMTGEHDRLAPPPEIRSVARRIHAAARRPDVRFEEIPGAGHVCNLEAPSFYTNILAEFLTQRIL